MVIFETLQNYLSELFLCFSEQFFLCYNTLNLPFSLDKNMFYKLCVKIQHWLLSDCYVQEGRWLCISMGSLQLFLFRPVSLIPFHQICYFHCPRFHFPLGSGMEKIGWCFMSGSQCCSSEMPLPLHTCCFTPPPKAEELGVDNTYGIVTRILQVSLLRSFLRY